MCLKGLNYLPNMVLGIDAAKKVEIIFDLMTIIDHV